MSRTSSLSGLGRGRAHGRRDIAEGEQLAKRRPGRSRAEDWEGELAEFQSEAGSQWIAMEDSAPSPYLGYISRDLRCVNDALQVLTRYSGVVCGFLLMSLITRCSAIAPLLLQPQLRPAAKTRQVRVRRRRPGHRGTERRRRRCLALPSPSTYVQPVSTPIPPKNTNSPSRERIHINNVIIKVLWLGGVVCQTRDGLTPGRCIIR